MTQIKPWRLLRSKLVFDEPWYRLRRDWLMLPDGREIDDYYVSMRPEVVLVFAVTPEDEVVLVQQYKHGCTAILKEFPGGTFILGEESAEDAAARELSEETGYVAQKFVFLGTAWDDPTRQDNRVHMFLALGAVKSGAQSLDENEDIEVVTIPLRKLKSMCISGEICVTGTLATAFLGLEAMNRM